MSMFLKKTWVGVALLLTLISAIGPGPVHAQVQLSHPTGGWRASASSGAFMQDVNYPASRVNLREGASVSAQISGHIQQAGGGNHHHKSHIAPLHAHNAVFLAR